MKRVILIGLIIIMHSSFVYGGTVDDVRSMVGLDRVDSQYSREELNSIVSQYLAVEAANSTARKFESGELVDNSEEVSLSISDKELEIESAQLELLEVFSTGGSVSEVLSSKSRLENLFYELEDLSSVQVYVEVEYMENIWSDLYIEAIETLEYLDSVEDIGLVGSSMPCITRDTLTMYDLVGHIYDWNNGIVLEFTSKSGIRAQWNGVVEVVESLDSSMYGVFMEGSKRVVINHSNGLKTEYIGLFPYVSEGDIIAQGSVIGDTSTLLEYCVELDGVYINPLYIMGKNAENAYLTFLSNNVKYTTYRFDILPNIKYEPT